MLLLQWTYLVCFGAANPNMQSSSGKYTQRFFLLYVIYMYLVGYFLYVPKIIALLSQVIVLYNTFKHLFFLLSDKQRIP